MENTKIALMSIITVILGVCWLLVHLAGWVSFLGDGLWARAGMLLSGIIAPALLIAISRDLKK